MDLISILSLAAALFVLAATPGPGVFATVSRSLASGFVPSLAVITGIVTGDVIFLLFAILGMSFVAQAMGHFFIVVKIIGGGYLIFLGVKIWRSGPVPAQEPNVKKSMKYGNYFTGFLITLSNPKVILFYCGFLPSFMDLASLSLIDILVVVTTVLIVLSSVLSFYAFLANRARSLFLSKRSVKRLNRTAGGVMIATGVAIAVKS
ncbi:MAG: LysE family translocator [Deltaproteobacteria bacterium]|nr:LysE family translocator [Deltaproteobacteria bacterium]